MHDFAPAALIVHLPEIEAAGARAPEPGELEAPAPCGDAHELNAAYAAGVEEALTRAMTAVEEVTLSASAQIEAVRREWSSECQRRLCEEVEKARAGFEYRLSRSLVDALAPFLELRQRERVRAAFLTRLREVISESPDATIQISGPEGEIAIIANCLGQARLRLVHASTAGDVLRAEIGSSVLRADFAQWANWLFMEFGEPDNVDK